MSIRELAEQILRSFGMWRLPIDPLKIADHEGIVAKAGNFGDKFDARIEYYDSLKLFCIFYAVPEGWRTEGRVRFSLSHELGHYYLPNHRSKLLNHWAHNSITDFCSDDPLEAQADEFAAELLMPMELFRAELDRFRLGFCNLEDLLQLANRLQTSVTSTARRYCESDREPCTIFFSHSGRMRWSHASEDMRRSGMHFYRYNTDPPKKSKTCELWAMLRDGQTPQKLEGRVRADYWFNNPQSTYLWEEAMPLGNTGRVITQLTPDD